MAYIKNYTALDFETANCSRASVCAVGFVRVENDKIVEQRHQLIRPEGRFDYRCTMVHGLTEFDVRDAPTFADYWHELRPFLSDNVVAHNAPFDISCLKASLDLYGLEAIDFKYMCTLAISRRTLALPSCALDSLVRHFDLGGFRHHNALDDALMCAKIFDILDKKTDVEKFAKNFITKKLSKTKLKIVNFENVDSPKFSPSDSQNINIANKNFPAKTSVQPELFEFANIIDSAKFAAKKISEKSSSLKNNSWENAFEFDFSPIDFSKNFSVVGIFNSMTRADAEGVILKLGGKIERTVSRFTDYIIIGDVPPPSWEHGDWGREIDRAFEFGRASFICESHFLKEVL